MVWLVRQAGAPDLYLLLEFQSGVDYSTPFLPEFQTPQSLLTRLEAEDLQKFNEALAAQRIIDAPLWR